MYMHVELRINLYSEEAHFKGSHTRESSAQINYVIVEKLFNELAAHSTHDKSVDSDFMELT